MWMPIVEFGGPDGITFGFILSRRTPRYRLQLVGWMV
jgi:hypothetical protein